MIIIAESGSTKTEWIFIDNKQVKLNLQKEGFNPKYFAASVLENMVGGFINTIKPEEVEQIYFYGSGCSSEESKKVVSTVLNKFFSDAHIEVHHDLFGAARALFGNKTGIVSILGTGSSSCLIQKGVITHEVPSLGYLLADEGSGRHLGSLILNAYFKNDLPESLSRKFESDFGINKNTFITQLYAHEKPNAYIASFTPFVIEHRQNKAVDNLIKKAFRIFFNEIILKYPDYKKYDLGFLGSVAFLLKEHLISVAGEFGLKVGKVIKNPVDELIAFHSE